MLEPISEHQSFFRVLFTRPYITVSNVLCVIRLCLLPVVFHFLMVHENMLALLFIGIGVITDLSDGYIARRFSQVSELGKFLDPLVDKVSAQVTLIFLAYRNFEDYATYPLILTFGTCFYFAVGTIYVFAVPFIVKKSGKVPLSNLAGKVSAITTVLVVVMYVLELHPWADAIMVIAIGMSITSGVIYFLRDLHNRNKIGKIGWANRLTLLRILLSPLFLLVFFCDGNSSFDDNKLIFKALAVLLVIALVVSDRIDGNIARKNNEVSDLGKLLDPFADKIALLTIFLCFIATDWAMVWMVALIYYREATVSFLRTLAATERIVLAAQPSGKIKTAVQATVAITLLSLSFLRDVADAAGLTVYAGVFFDAWDIIWEWLPYSSMVLVTVISIGSGVDYLWQNRKVIMSALRKG